MGQNFSSPSGKILLDMIDKCVYMPYPEPATVENANLLELIPTGNETGGPKNMRELLDSMVNAPFNAVFDQLAKVKEETPTPDLSSSPELTSLRDRLRASDVTASILLDETEARATADLSPMMADSVLGSWLSSSRPIATT
eukprot:SRR837773.10737.p2 GENE.SRR837773.10737~~SRR837773.10737.p2  ORF type:complete len:152 (-),score=48.48 SRR837773.10737:326-748(-)